VGKQVLLDARLFTGGADLTGSSNKIELSSQVEDKDATTFASGGWKEVLGGLASTTVTGSGLWEAGDPSKVDDDRWAAIGGIGPWTICPAQANVGSLAYLVNALQTKYTLLGAVGDVAPWGAEASSTWPVARGRIAHPPGTARTASGTGTGQQLGALTAGQQLYAALHVLSVAGTATPSITVAIESSADNTFAAPTTRAVFTAATAAGGQIVRAGGPITDQWFRPKWTISGTGPSFLFVAAFGIK
jgi:hypothetical protein